MKSPSPTNLTMLMRLRPIPVIWAHLFKNLISLDSVTRRTSQQLGTHGTMLAQLTAGIRWIDAPAMPANLRCQSLMCKHLSSSSTPRVPSLLASLTLAARAIPSDLVLVASNQLVAPSSLRRAPLNLANFRVPVLRHLDSSPQCSRRTLTFLIRTCLRHLLRNSLHMLHQPKSTSMRRLSRQAKVPLAFQHQALNSTLLRLRSPLTLMPSQVQPARAMAASLEVLTFLQVICNRT